MVQPRKSNLKLNQLKIHFFINEINGNIKFLTSVNFRSVNEMPNGNVKSHVGLILQYVYFEFKKGPVSGVYDVILSLNLMIVFECTLKL